MIDFVVGRAWSPGVKGTHAVSSRGLSFFLENALVGYLKTYEYTRRCYR